MAIFLYIIMVLTERSYALSAVFSHDDSLQVPKTILARLYPKLGLRIVTEGLV